MMPLTGSSPKACIVAEIGVNHDGDKDEAKRLISAAKGAHADAVKIQLYEPQELTSDPQEYHTLTGVNLNPNDLPDIVNHAAKIGIPLFASVFDPTSLERAVSLELPVIKLGAGELTNKPLHEAVAETGLPVICSTGAALLEEVAPVVELYRSAGTELVLLHCVSAYPTPEELVNLRSICVLRDTFDCPVGFSDHTRGLTAGILAVALGAVVLEKHITVDPKATGPDHKASINISDLKAYVHYVRHAEQMLGKFDRQVPPAELAVRAKARKRLVARCGIEEGTMLRHEHIGCLRPATGMSPMDIGKLLGHRLRRNVLAGDTLWPEDVA